jgi:hypothetical protein
MQSIGVAGIGCDSLLCWNGIAANLRQHPRLSRKDDPALPCRALDYAVPSGLASFPDPTRHSRAGLSIMPSLRDSPHSRILPGTSVPGSRLCRPVGTRLIPGSYPTLPCRALDCAVPSGLASFPDPIRHFRAGLLIMPSRRDSPHSRILPGTSVPGSRLCRPVGTRLIPGSYPTLPCRALDYAVPSRLASSPDPTRHFRAGLSIVPPFGTRLIP